LDHLDPSLGSDLSKDQCFVEEVVKQRSLLLSKRLLASMSGEISYTVKILQNSVCR
jgi:hypothetical protein